MLRAVSPVAQGDQGVGTRQVQPPPDQGQMRCTCSWGSVPLIITRGLGRNLLGPLALRVPAVELVQNGSGPLSSYYSQSP